MNKEVTKMLRYEFKPTLGLRLFHGFAPYKKVVNNGCVIETQDDQLVEQLEKDEADRIEEPIDWHLFKVGETILIDNFGNRFACSVNNNGQQIQLEKIIDQ